MSAISRTSRNLAIHHRRYCRPANPRLVATVTLDDPAWHSHKVRVVGDLMVVNHERNPTPVGRLAEQLPGVRRDLREMLGREPRVPNCRGSSM